MNTVEQQQKMWDVEANGGLPYPLGRSDLPSVTRVYWRCEKGHLWDTFLSARKRTGCPYCFGRFAIPGETDLGTTHPHLIARWSPKNTINVATVKAGSDKKALWVCEEGHEITRRISLMAIRFRCEVCESFGFLRPEKSKLWHPTKNLNLTPYDVILKSAKIVWWKCDEGHEWQARVFSQNISSCPACSGFKLIPGAVDINTLRPWVIPYWSDRNEQDLTTIHPENKGQYYWNCQFRSHAWKGRIFDEPTGGYNPCKVCRNKTILPGFNDLVTLFPQLALEWHDVKNTKNITEISPFGIHKIWWKCDKGHEWVCRLSDRTSRKATGCPTCSAGSNQSSDEKEISEYICGLLGEAEVETQVRYVLSKRELDIYLPNHQVAIEYNGIYWHSEAARKTRKYHYEKWLACKEKGITLIQIWEDQWLQNPELVKHVISQSLVKQPTIAEKYITELSNIESSAFLSLYSFNPKYSGSIKLGLKVVSSNELIVVMVLKKQGEDFHVVNFASKDSPAENMKSFLDYVEAEYLISSITAITDNCSGESLFYTQAGFEAKSEKPVTYSYTKNNKRIPRKEYTIERFRTDSNLMFTEGLTERELADLNGLNRIWDAGQTRWELPK